MKFETRYIERKRNKKRGKMNKVSVKLVTTLATLCILVSSQAYAAITMTWGTGTGAYLEDSGGTKLFGDSTATGYNSGAFIQVIWTGGDGTISPFDASSLNGVNALADDKVVATEWVGKGYPISGTGGNRNGYFVDTMSLTQGTALGSKFYIRFFDTTASNYPLGYVPTSGKYSDYTDASFTITQGMIDSGLGTMKVLSSQLATTPVTVPEPSTIGLLLVGAGLVVFGRMRRS